MTWRHSSRAYCCSEERSRILRGASARAASRVVAGAHAEPGEEVDCGFTAGCLDVGKISFEFAARIGRVTGIDQKAQAMICDSGPGWR